jgi:pyruvate/2-oxoglutarate dehydrogenase complex dihydrolipoamide acyltransferase (E2) component
MAVAIDGGLITPTIIKAQEQDLFSISRTWKELVDKAKAKKLSPAEYSSGTACFYNIFTFSFLSFVSCIAMPNTQQVDSALFCRHHFSSNQRNV